MKKHFYLLIAAVMALLFSFAACGGDDDVKVKGVSLNKAVASIAVNATETLTVNFEPETPKNKTVSWASSNTSVATVTDNGSVRGVAPGTSNVTVTTEQGDFKATCVVTVFIPPPTGVALSKTSTQITAGMDERLTATVAPSGANQTVTWQSSNHAVASVFSEGNPDGSVTVIAVSPGAANITATASNGVVSASPCVVTVTPNNIVATSVIVSPAELRLMATTPVTPDSAATAQLTAYVDPPNVTGGPVVWSTSDPTKATVSAAGQVRAVAGTGTGTVDIIATSGTATGKCALTVVDPVRPTGVSVAPTTATISAGQTLALTATLAPTGVTYPEVTWSTSNDAVATVSGRGLSAEVFGEGGATTPRTATITARTPDGGHTATCTVTVNPVPVIGVSISPATAECLLDGTLQLTAHIEPSHAGNHNVTWSTSNAAIATVSATGLVSGRALGEATITARTEEGNFTATANVTVVTELSIMNVYTSGHMSQQGLFGNLYFPIWGINEKSWLLDPEFYDYGRGYGVSVDGNGDVYVAGYNDDTPSWVNQAVLWKNGGGGGAADPSRPIVLAKPAGNSASLRSEARAIYIDGSDNIYVGGFALANSIYTPIIWRNNVPAALPVSATEAVVNSVTVVGSDVYAAGYDIVSNVVRACYWRNGVQTLLPLGTGMDGAWGASIAVSGSDVYVAGYLLNPSDETFPALWRNGSLQLLASLPGTESRGVALSVGLSGSNVYVAGYLLKNDGDWDVITGVVWENGVPVPLGPVASSTIDTQALGIYVYRGNVFVSGALAEYTLAGAAVRWDMLYWRKVGGTYQSNVIDPPLDGDGDVADSWGNNPWSIFVSPL